MITLSIPPLFDDFGFVQVDAFLSGHTESRIVIAAGANTWASPSGLVGLRSLVDELHTAGRSVSIDLPRSPAAGLRFVASGLSLGLPVHGAVSSPLGETVTGWAGVPIVQLQDAGDVERFANEVFLAARSADPRSAPFLATAAGELGSNAVAHGGAGDALGILEFADDGYELAVVDRGAGMQVTWSARYPVWTDADALLAALSVVSSPGLGGMGLPDLFGRTAAPDVEFVLRSGYHGLRVRDRHGSLEELTRPLAGTFAIFRKRPTQQEA